MNCVNVSYRVPVTAAEEFLPPPLIVDEQAPGQVELAFSDAASVGSDARDRHVTAPAETEFRECLLKVRCRLGERSGWFVAISWVTGDTSLVRGFLMGFPKRLGHVAITRFVDISGRVGGRFQGAKVGAELQTLDGLSVRVVQHCDERVEKPSAPALPFFLRRHIPALGTQAAPMVDEIVELVSKDETVSDVWRGRGELVAGVRGVSEFEPLLRPIEPTTTRSFFAALRVLGIRRAAVEK